jgi:hypothetical protein
MVTPHVALNERRPGGSALDLRTTSRPDYAVSQRVRKRVEKIFGCIKTVGNFRRTRYRGVERTSFAAFCMRKLLVILNAMLHNKTHWQTPALASSTSPFPPS